MERALRNLQTTLFLVIIGITLNAQPVPFKVVSNNSTNFITMGNLVYFTSGDVLWRTNGTAAGTFQLKAGFTVEQFKPDWLREDMPEFAREFKGDFFFVNSNSRELWRSDGTSSGTILLKTSSLNNIRILDSTADYLFFVASDASTGQELYRTNGTMSGTMIVKDINPGSADGFFGSAAVVGSELFFSANDGVHGREPWKSTGTSAGTKMIKDVNPGSADGFGGTTPKGFNGLFFFTGKTPYTGTDPWATDGTPEGTYILSNQTGEFEDRRSVDYEIVHDGYLYFIIRETYGYGTEGHLWRTDGTPVNTSFIKVVGLAEKLDPVRYFRVYKNKIYFWNTGDELISRLWVSDGTAAGTNEIFSIYTIDGEITFFEVVNNFLLFTGHSSGYPLDLYRSDGTGEGTGVFVTRKASYRYGRDITGDITKVGNLALYAEHDGPTSPRDESGTPYNESDYFHLFQTDAVTTKSIRTLFGVNTSGTDHIANFNGKVLFSTYDDYPNATGAVRQLWIYDPLSSGNTQAGKLSVETWTGIPGTHVSAIPVNSPPSSTSEITIFETPKNIGDNYGSRVRGYVIPPATGNYTFWISSDDKSELWLSIDATPANRKRIAYVSGWTTSRQWDKYTTQKSAPVSLVAGRKYYVEALLKEGTGGDHLAVGWQLPNSTIERPIPGNRLIPFNRLANTSPQVAITSPENGQVFTAPADIVINAKASDPDGSVAKVEFYNGTTKLGEDASSPYSFTWNDVAKGNYTIAAKAIDNDGANHTHSINISVTGGAACAGTGTISVETWIGIDGRRVSSIPVNSSPNLTGKRNIFEAPTNIGNNFGSRFRGYLCVPTTGNYTFWIASDDHGELWLSTDGDPANKRRIAYHTGWTSPRQWTKFATQQSAPISLVGGQQYYIEALYKEDEGGDNMAVGWKLPDGKLERPIPGNRLSPFAEASATMASQSISSNPNLYEQISIYPNPARSGDPELTISGYEGIERTIETEIEIISITGEVVFSERISCGGNCGSYLMNVKQLVPGVYVVNMKTDGVRTSQRLLVK